MRTEFAHSQRLQRVLQSQLHMLPANTIAHRRASLEHLRELRTSLKAVIEGGQRTERNSPGAPLVRFMREEPQKRIVLNPVETQRIRRKQKMQRDPITSWDKRLSRTITDLRPAETREFAARRGNYPLWEPCQRDCFSMKL